MLSKLIRMRRRIILLVIIGIIVAVFCFITLFAYMRRYDPVLMALDPDIRDDHGFQLLNPFRDKSPEVPALAFLDQLKSGRCSTALEVFEKDNDRRMTICRNESLYPIISWRLEARGRDGERVLLRYRVTRISGHKHFGDPFWIWVTNRNNNHWQVTGYEPWY
jgi:hypothetical protein